MIFVANELKFRFESMALFLLWLITEYICEHVMMMRNEDDDVKGGRDWWSEMPGADRFPPILHHLLSIGWDRDDHIGRDREYDKADDDHIGGHDQLMMTMIPEKLLQF